MNGNSFGSTPRAGAAAPGPVMAAALVTAVAASAATALELELELNDDSRFRTGAATTLLLDGEPVGEDDLRGRTDGMVATLSVGADVSDDFSSGTALSVALDHLLKGPVTGVSPLTVLGQPVVVTGDTAAVDLPGGSVGGLAVGDVVEVAGFADVDNSVRATRLAFKPSGTPVWKLTGRVSGVGAGVFSIGPQRVGLAGVAPRDCGGGLDVGRLVEVKAAANAGFTAGATLTGVSDVECRAGGLSAPAGQRVPAQVEGLLTVLTAADDFIVNGQRVVTTTGTVFRGGTGEDLAPGVRLEAEGRLDSGTGVLTASRITFREVRVRIEAPAGPGDVVSGVNGSVTLLGITARLTAQTRDEDGIGAGGLGGSAQLELRGFRDRNGQVYVQRLRERGDADPNDVRLRGPVDAIEPPRFDILGVTVDTGSSTLRDSAGNPLSATGFFARIGIGTQVQIEDASLSGGRLGNGRIEIEEPDDSGAGARRRGQPRNGVSVGGVGIGTVTGFTFGVGGIFSDGFENR